VCTKTITELVLVLVFLVGMLTGWGLRALLGYLGK